MRALDLGPAYLPEELLVAGRMRALLGLKVHANTISHARLVALEETYPRTRALLGHEKFNEHSRRFLDRPGATAHALARIGEDFAAFVDATGEARAAADLAVFEWAWLEAYHAAEAPVLALADLAGIDEGALLDIMLARHPAAHLLHLDRAVHWLIGDEVPELCDAHAILLARPHAEVLVSPATSRMSAIFEQLEAPVSICNLFEACAEPVPGDQPPPVDIMPALIALLEAGALRRVG